jgi:sugar phosphate isomerase/epimerase
VLANLGYDGVALTLDHLHLDPYAPDLAGRTAALRQRLEELELDVVIETGARYLLDPRRKHHPTLVSSDGVDLRVDYLRRAIEVAADLGAEAVSFWSGTLPTRVSADTGWDRLCAGVSAMLDVADRAGVVCAFEPEPGMFVDRLDGVLELRRRLSEPDNLRVTLDVGHVVCNEPRSMAATIESAGPLLANVQLDDMRPGVHEHLEFGDGEVDLDVVLDSLEAVGYRGLSSVELPRHGHAAPAVAERSLSHLRRSTHRRLAPVEVTG